LNYTRIRRDFSRPASRLGYAAASRQAEQRNTRAGLGDSACPCSPKATSGAWRSLSPDWTAAEAAVGAWHCQQTPYHVKMALSALAQRHFPA